MNRTAARKRIFLPPFLLFLLLFPACSDHGGPAVKDRPAPEFTVIDPQGNTLKLSDLRGKVVFLNFWATWCESCKTEKPYMASMYGRMKDNPEFRMVTVLFNDDPSKAKEYLARHSYDLPYYYESGKSAKAYGLTGVPETYIIDKKGVLREKVIGPLKWDSPEVIGSLQTLTRE